MNSKQKGKRGEREAAADLSAVTGRKWRRGQQFQGRPESPDILCDELPELHVEVKRTEAFGVYKALGQALDDSSPGQVPVVWHKRNNHDPVLCLFSSDLMRIVAALAPEENP